MIDKINAYKYFVNKCSVLFQQWTSPFKVARVHGGRSGFTLVELIVVCAILGVLSAMALPLLNGYVKTTKNNACAFDLRTIEKAISAYSMENNNALPASLNDVGMGAQLDPWKRPYEYQIVVSGSELEDFLGRPMNTDYDLYSRGEDGQSSPASGNPGNADDIVRSSDGNFVGLRD